MNTIEASVGRWREILPALGIPQDLLDGKHHACPICGGKDRFRFDDRLGRGGYYCSQCKPGLGFNLLSKFHGWDFARAAKEVDAVIGNLKPSVGIVPVASGPPDRVVLGRLKARAKPVGFGCPVAKYLTRRGLSGPPWPRGIAHVPRMKHLPSGMVFPVMLAALITADGKLGTFHRTFLTEDGRKAAVTPVRMFIKGDLPRGGAIRLAEAAETMGVAEGIETALAASRLSGMPVWATCTEGMLRHWVPPAAAKHVVIFADADENFVGQSAAYDLAKRLVRDGRTAEIRVPEQSGTDWNDVLVSHA